MLRREAEVLEKDHPRSRKPLRRGASSTSGYPSNPQEDADVRSPKRTPYIGPIERLTLPLSCEQVSLTGESERPETSAQRASVQRPKPVQRRATTTSPFLTPQLRQPPMPAASIDL
jgi:hypothetical protein